ncbi:YfgM family protein [Xanthomonas massiliensis]|uniref:YfgM family protein n=1 Tax=Xanthomonas massiliensis TaxID=1720302 RepID=UPI0008264ECA|nr:tetratricopeptide repeat protein [Xanthomonas massiliensis]
MAIDELLDEHEQSERVRSWLRNNGGALLGGIVLALAIILGWQWWRKHDQSQQVQANDAYAAVVKDLDAGKLDQAGSNLGKLEQGRVGIYADLAALRLAKAQVEAGKRDEAIKTLQGVKAKGEARVLVDQRLARLLVDAGKTDDAIKLVAGKDDAASTEIRGDALFAQGKRDQAREAYTKALALMDVAAPQRRLLEMKLMQAGGTVPETAEPNR